jgi:23S rRNA (adenine2503-C2)-methyltransferase
MYEDIKAYFDEKKLPKFRFKQFEDAIFKNRVSSFDEISNFSKELREDLTKYFSLNSLILVNSQKSENTIKFVLKTNDNNFIESVLMLHKDNRRTVCVSSQIFCPLDCKFCATGANKFGRNLNVKEIVEQVLFINRYLKNKNQNVTNIVFMGMGEPFLNYNNVIESLKIFNEKIGIGARHITVSTSGIIPKIYEYANLKKQSRLAISLHGASDKLRSEIMPINKRYPLKELMDACDNYTKKTNKRISYEYVLISGINDSISDAEDLYKLLKDKLAHINLLIYNPHEFSSYKRPEKNVVLAFRDFLEEKGMEVSIRRSMGDDISGACGQLSAKEVNK